MVIFWYDRFWNKSIRSWFSQKFANRKKLHLQTFSLTRRSDSFWNYLSWRIIFLLAASVWESPSFLMTLRGIAEWNRLSCLPDGEKGSSSDEELKRVTSTNETFIMTERLTWSIWRMAASSSERSEADRPPWGEERWCWLPGWSGRPRPLEERQPAGPGTRLVHSRSEVRSDMRSEVHNMLLSPAL